MSVVSTTRMIDKGGSSIDERGNRSYEVVYQVITNNIADGAGIVMRAPGLPAVYSIYNADHEYDTGSTLKNYSTSRTSDPCIWEVTCHYESWAQVIRDLRGANPDMQAALADPNATSSSQSQPGGFDAQDPTSRPPRVSGGNRHYTRSVAKDNVGNATVTSSGERFDPPIEKDDKRPYLTITRNEAVSPNQLATFLGRINQYQDAVNSDVFLGQPIASAKMAISYSRQFENRVLFWEVTYDIEFRKDLWIPFKVLDAGYHTLKVGNTAPGARILDSNGNPCASPVPLYTVVNAETPGVPSGSAVGDVIQLPGSGFDPRFPPQYKSFTIYDSLPFSVFNLSVPY